MCRFLARLAVPLGQNRQDVPVSISRLSGLAVVEAGQMLVAESHQVEAEVVR